jgi:hypothetical protein
MWIMALLLVVFVAACGREQGTVAPTLTAVTGINPNRGTQGQTLGVTLTGTGFETGATINLSGALIGVSNLAVVSSTQINATFAIATNAVLGPVNISVTTSGQTTNSVPYTIYPPLAVTHTIPSNGASNVPINQVISANFTEGGAVQALNCATVTTSSFTLTGPAGAVAGTVACTGATATVTFTPTSLLASNVSYTATLTTAIQDSIGNPLLSNYVWSFSTAPLPTVTSTIPANGATYVAINQVLTATFNEAMDCATITTSSFTLTGPGGAVAGTVTCSGTNATFTPTSLLTASTVYTATITTGATNVGGAALASNYVWSFTTSPNPAVVSTIPTNGATGVPVNEVLTAIFNEGVNCSTVTLSTFTLAGPGGAVAGTVGCAGTSATSATFTPTSLLASNSSYTATLTTGIANPQGEAMLSNYVWTFTTGLAPVVTSTVPANGATIVPVNQVLSATFSEQMNCSTITASSFTLTGPGGAVTGIVACAGTSATFTPTSLLLGATAYTATITTGATNVAGAALAGNYGWTFTTVGGLTVTATIPTNAATAVPTDQQITAIFSQPVECSTITTSSFTLTGPSGAVGGTVGCVGASATSATFTPSTHLATNTTYTGTITTAVTEPGPGFTAIVIPYVWTFKTGPTPSTVPPTVTAVTPLNLATGVGYNTTITAMFDEAMDPTTMNGSTFTLATGCAPAGTLVSGVVTYNAINNIITLTPTSNLATLTCYTATVTTGAKNLADVAMAANFVWTFTTGAAPDLTPPTVISTIPVNLATNVPLNQNITATFSKAMNDNTINTTTFTLFQGTTPIPGTVAYIAGSTTAIFVPTSNLVLDTVYTATITTGVADLSGNFMVSDFVWNFSTGASIIVPPTVLSTNPANNATGVCINATINATFSTAMDPTTITTATFTVTTAALVPVTGTVTLDVTGTIATFTPSSDLAPSTSYIATITTGAADLADNALASDYVWSFTTGTAAACLPPPTLGAVAPFGGFGGGAGMTNQGINTVIHGDIGTTGASTTMTGFHDNLVAYLPPAGCIYTETPLNIGDVTGQIFTAPPPPTITCPNEGTAVTFATATAAAAAALAAYNNLAGLPSGPDPGAGQLGGLTLAPGTYTAAAGSFLLTGSDLTLDAQGNANAVWVFQMATSLTVGAAGAPRSVILINGAKAGNVFWQVGSAATINAAGGGTFAGTIIAKAGVVVSTAGNAAITTINGRALGLNASVTLVNTVINVP